MFYVWGSRDQGEQKRKDSKKKKKANKKRVCMLNYMYKLKKC